MIALHHLPVFGCHVIAAGKQRLAVQHAIERIGTADRAGSRLQASLNALKRAHEVDLVLPYSSKTGMGQDELWKHLRAASSAAAPSTENA